MICNNSKNRKTSITKHRNKNSWQIVMSTHSSSWKTKSSINRWY